VRVKEFIKEKKGKCKVIYRKNWNDIVEEVIKSGILNLKPAAVQQRWLGPNLSLVQLQKGIFALKREKKRLIRPARLIREMKNAYRLELYGISTVAPFAVFYERGYFFALSPFYKEHRSGLHMMNEGDWMSMDWQSKRRIVEAAADVVASLHLCGFVHTDLNPSNLLFAALQGGKPSVVLLDVGGIKCNSRLKDRVSDLARLWRSAREVVLPPLALRFLVLYCRRLRLNPHKVSKKIKKRLARISKS